MAVRGSLGLRGLDLKTPSNVQPGTLSRSPWGRCRVHPPRGGRCDDLSHNLSLSLSLALSHSLSLSLSLSQHRRVDGSLTPPTICQCQIAVQSNMSSANGLPASLPLLCCLCLCRCRCLCHCLCLSVCLFSFSLQGLGVIGPPSPAVVFTTGWHASLSQVCE